MRWQASFTALNIIPDDHAEDEIDNTKEIQIEDALKLYQVALKLHSQGPDQYENAAKAYQELLKSEVFRYPESESEFQRVYNHPEFEYVDAAIALELAAAGANGAPCNLPQILYLSYKNHGQFILDCVKSLLQHAKISSHELGYQGIAAVENFSLAIVSDESDTDLWRRIARVSAMLGSKRISRYCLEAALEVDDDPTVAEVEPASLEEGFAGEQLKEHLEILYDDVALLHPIMIPYLEKSMPKFLSKYKDLYPYLPDETRSFRYGERELKSTTLQLMIEVESRTWSGVGDRFCELWLSSYELGHPGAAVGIQITHQLKDVQEIETTTSQTGVVDQYSKDVEMTDAPTLDSSEIASVSFVGSRFTGESINLLNTATNSRAADETLPSVVILPTRKRSQSTAGFCDVRDDDIGAQKRSKRIRNRDTLADENVDSATQYAEQLEKFAQSDEVVFDFVGSILKKLDIHDLGTIKELQEALALKKPIDNEEIIANTALRDLRDILKTWDDVKASTFVDGNTADILGSSVGGENAGLTAFLNQHEIESTKLSNFPILNETEGLDEFIGLLNSRWTPLQDAIFEWILVILPTYITNIWSERLKLSVVRLISYVDADLFSRFQYDAKQLRSNKRNMIHLVEMTQSVFEIHLDIYAQIIGPNSTVSYNTRNLSHDRLRRWAGLSADIVGTYISDSRSDLSLRYLWTFALYATLTDDVTREHKISCWSDLESHIEEAGDHIIELPNNAAMPEISASAAEREASKLKTMDFFFNLFQADRSDPIVIIETLEPVLDPDCAIQPHIETEDTLASTTGSPASLKDMWKFLKSGSTPLRLFLWQRLREAYLSIGYSTQVFSCHLRSIEVIVEDLRSSNYTESAEDSRQHKLLNWLKALDDLLVKSLTMALNEYETCFEIIDERQLKSICATIAQLSRILHAAAIFDDEIRVKMVQLPATAIFSERGSFNGFINKLREMQVRTWALQYTLIKEAMSQFKELFPMPNILMMDYLAKIHNALGIRKMCKISNKIFLKMMKVELIRMKQIDRWEDYLGQVLYDLYGIKLGIGTRPLEEHGCPPEQLDKKTALSIADQVIAIANSLSMKDLLKHDLRVTIERMQAVAGLVKPSSQMQHNLRNYNMYLKTSISPLELHQAWKGQLQVNLLPVTAMENTLSRKGWYFLLGMISLTKYRSTKRLSPGPQSDDIRVASNYMRLHLQCNSDHWETWYHLALCFDYELEEEVLWSTDKINHHRTELVKIQRSAIHCYAMALSTAHQVADVSLKTGKKLSEMYQDFGMRLYASSRDPFSMEVFYLDDFERHMSGVSGLYKRALHAEMTKYRVWKFAAKLFRASLRERPDNWINHYMLAKCLWKMYYHLTKEEDPKVKENNPPTVKDILRACLDAIKTVPKPSKSSVEPIIEPHYKIVSIVHKLVKMEAITAQAGADLIQQQPFAARKGQPVIITNYEEEWSSYIIEQVRQLRKEDKQHWQHRMISRVASLLYENDEPMPSQNKAVSAKNEFRESMFTKTMHIQVWKPDHERPGRHCVFMERYTRRMVRLLEITNDKSNLEALVKRIRKKGNEFYRFTQVWTEACIAYLRIIRQAGCIPSSVDDIFKSTPADEFEIMSHQLTVWISDPLMYHPALEALRDTSELKKINANLMKPAPIDDLINDAWAVLYTDVAKKLLIPDLLGGKIDTSEDKNSPHKRPGGVSNSSTNATINSSKTQNVVGVATVPTKERPKKIGVSRREVLRRAESAVNRTTDQQRSSNIGKPSIMNMLFGSNLGLETQKDKLEPIKTDKIQKSSEIRVETVEGSAGISIENLIQAEGEEECDSDRESLYDSSGDESDLSDVPDMDDIDSASIFPNLLRKDSE
ncbi:putative transcriptional corepressor of histone genes [Erysiphe necator]|uniref:Histone transcription regulator 3 homolog n=1 Tax=Uncinula necator TaxID=52586 RepID=A0A0B1P4V8_UNCNE|nr:putative transcriptional corepressor of histone genes [Erysiphe necator]